MCLNHLIRMYYQNVFNQFRISSLCLTVHLNHPTSTFTQHNNVNPILLTRHNEICHQAEVFFFQSCKCFFWKPKYCTHKIPSPVEAHSYQTLSPLSHKCARIQLCMLYRLPGVLSNFHLPKFFSPSCSLSSPGKSWHVTRTVLPDMTVTAD